MIFNISQTLLTTIGIIQKYISHYLVKFYYGKKRREGFYFVFSMKINFIKTKINIT